MPQVTPPTPMQLAAAGVDVRMGAALLVLHRKLPLDTARRAMRQAVNALHTPVQARLTDGLLKEACRQVDLQLRSVAIGPNDPVMKAKQSGDVRLTRRRQLRQHVNMSTDRVTELNTSPTVERWSYIGLPEPLALNSY